MSYPGNSSGRLPACGGSPDGVRVVGVGSQGLPTPTTRTPACEALEALRKQRGTPEELPSSIMGMTHLLMLLGGVAI